MKNIYFILFTKISHIFFTYENSLNDRKNNNKSLTNKKNNNNKS